MTPITEAPERQEEWLLTEEYLSYLEGQANRWFGPTYGVTVPHDALRQFVNYVRHHEEDMKERGAQLRAYEEGVRKALEWLEYGDIESAERALQEADRKVHEATDAP